MESAADPRKASLFEHLSPAAPAGVPTGTCRTVWLSFRIPAQVAAGVYTGQATVKAQGMEPVLVPVEVEVLDWRRAEWPELDQAARGRAGAVGRPETNMVTMLVGLSSGVMGHHGEALPLIGPVPSDQWCWPSVR